MTLQEIKLAVKQAQDHCQLLENAYKEKVLPYEMASARSVLVNLNYNPNEQNEILDYIHAEGFAYCLDPRFPVKNENGKEESTPEFACWWGIDQLRSRLQCVR